MLRWRHVARPLETRVGSKTGTNSSRSGDLQGCLNSVKGVPVNRSTGLRTLHGLSFSAADCESEEGERERRRASGGAMEERCQDAKALPVALPLQGSWQLVDDGKEKGVPKLGYASTRAGETLRVGPIWGDQGCAALHVTLGYLASWRPSQGVLRIACEGCKCSSIRTYWQRSM